MQTAPSRLRRVLHATTLALLAAVAVPMAELANAANAADPAWPSQPVTLVVPYAAGGNVDAMARWVVPELSRRLGQPVVIDNVAGAGGVIGTDKVVRAKPDGYTLLLSVESTIVIARMVTPSTVRYDGLRDLVPVTLLGTQPLVLVGKTDQPARTAAELYQDMQKHPGKYSYASSGVGTSLHLGGEMLRQLGRVELVHVPYRVGTQIVTDLGGNQLDLAVLPLSMVMEQARAGRLRVFGVLDDKPSPAMPQVPALGADVPAWKDALVAVWQGVFVPRGTPPQVIARLDTALREVLAQPGLRKSFEDSGVTPVGMGPAAFATFLKAEQQKFGTVVTRGGIKAE
ncbi:MAG TPA: tripartite tricarboxylate transporter substrate binding protein [Pseudorhodoferax sp.]|nr:tripartite tricarboxylate transporter substrate binding protein [Pseudorhodoferax sp.]